jgi:hypothetical protein
MLHEVSPTGVCQQRRYIPGISMMATATLPAHARCAAAAAAAAGLPFRLSLHGSGWRCMTTDPPQSHPTSGEAATAPGFQTRLIKGRLFVQVTCRPVALATVIAPACKVVCCWWLAACPACGRNRLCYFFKCSYVLSRGGQCRRGRGGYVHM